jgi:hypothetical protein
MMYESILVSDTLILLLLLLVLLLLLLLLSETTAREQTPVKTYQRLIRHYQDLVVCYSTMFGHAPRTEEYHAMPVEEISFMLKLHNFFD